MTAVGGARYAGLTDEEIRAVIDRALADPQPDMPEPPRLGEERELVQSNRSWPRDLTPLASVEGER